MDVDEDNDFSTINCYCDQTNMANSHMTLWIPSLTFVSSLLVSNSASKAKDNTRQNRFRQRVLPVTLLGIERETSFIQFICKVQIEASARGRGLLRPIK